MSIVHSGTVEKREIGTAGIRGMDRDCCMVEDRRRVYVVDY